MSYLFLIFLIFYDSSLIAIKRDLEAINAGHDVQVFICNLIIMASSNSCYLQMSFSFY